MADANPRTGRRATFLICSLLALCALALAYSNHFDNGFHFDDSHVIVDNLYLRSLHDVPRFFTDASTFSIRPENAQYRPLLTLSYAIDYWAAGGLDPAAFHRTQFGLLIALGLLLVPLYGRLCEASDPAPANRYVALFASLLFCIHTANTETVNYLSSRSSLVATLAVTASLLLYIAWPRGRVWLVYLLPMLIGGLAKPLTVMFAPILLAYRLLFVERLTPREVWSVAGRRKALSAIVATGPAFVAGVALYLFLTWMNPEAVRLSDIDRSSYALTQPYVWLHYLRLFAVPIGLTADTDWGPVTGAADPRIYVGLAFLAALVGVTLRLASFPRTRAAAFGIVWFAIALIPTSSVVPLAEVYNEHRIFFPYVGLTLAAVWLVALAARRVRRSGGAARRVVPAVLLVGAIGLVVAHAAGTHRRNRVWKDGLSLWEDVTRKSPANPRGLMNYGVALMKIGNVRQAVTYFERAREYSPDYEMLEINLGVAKAWLGEPGVEQHFRRALGISPGYARGRYFYAKWLASELRGPEALRQLESAVSISPADLEARGLLSRLLAARGDEMRLAEVVRETVSIAPDDRVARAYADGRDPVVAERETADAYTTLGRSAGSAGDWLDSAAAFRRAQALGADSSSGWNDLGWARFKLGFLDEAAECFRRALELDVNNEKARNNLELTRRP